MREARENEVEQGVRDIALAEGVEENTEKKVEKQTREGLDEGGNDPSEGHGNIAEEALEKGAAEEDVKEKDEVKDKAKLLDRPDEETILLGVVVPQVYFGSAPDPAAINSPPSPSTSWG